MRNEVRNFVAAELSDRTALQRTRSWLGFDADFSRKPGKKADVTVFDRFVLAWNYDSTYPRPRGRRATKSCSISS
jgi:hypothetical protein